MGISERNKNYQGWILYTRPEGIRNRHYIGLYREACRKYGMSVAVGILEPGNPFNLCIYGQNQPVFLCADGPEEPVISCAGSQEGQLEELVQRQRPDFVVNRTRDYRLAQALESYGVRVYNNSRIAELGNDKAKAYRYMQQRGITIMPVVFETDTEPEQYPVVVKSCDGHGGSEVFLIRHPEEWHHWKQNSYNKNKKYVVQQAASDLGKDLRVYVVGGQIAAGVLRTSGRDFRSNACLGGKAVMYELDSGQRGLVEKIIAGLDIGMAGIDFVFHHGRLVFNEIEDMAGARMLYALTDYNIVEAYVRYIRQELADEREGGFSLNG